MSDAVELVVRVREVCDRVREGRWAWQYAVGRVV